MSTSMKGGDTTIKRVKVSKGSSTNIFTALRNLRGELTHKTVKDDKRHNTSVILYSKLLMDIFLSLRTTSL